MDSAERDERVSWRAATTIMVVATVFTFVGWILGTDPFTRVFDILIVYVPTAVLVGLTIAQRARLLRNSHSTTVVGSTLENKVA